MSESAGESANESTDEADVFTPASRLTVCIDFKSPHAWLAVAPTRALENELGIAADWLPVVARAQLPPRSAPADADRGTRHRAMRAQYYERDLQRYAALRGITLGRASRMDDSSAAAMGLLWMKRQGADAAQRYIDAVFNGYFTDGQPLHIASVEVIGAIVARCDGDAEQFGAYAANSSATSGPDELATLQRRLQKIGLAQAPAYLVDGEVFYGRAHLPMIRWLLNDRVGEPPI